jgi:hypothetical protein
MTKTLSNQLGRFGITVNCIHPGTTRTERTPGLLEARAAQLGISPEELERRDFAPDAPRGNALCRMVDASEIGYLTAYLCSDHRPARLRRWCCAAAPPVPGETRRACASGMDVMAAHRRRRGMQPPEVARVAAWEATRGCCHSGRAVRPRSGRKGRRAPAGRRLACGWASLLPGKAWQQ